MYMWCMCTLVAGCVYHSLYCETGSLTEPGVRLAASKATQSSRLCPLQLWGPKHKWGYNQLFMVMLRIWTKVFCFYNKCPSSLRHLSKFFAYIFSNGPFPSVYYIYSICLLNMKLASLIGHLQTCVSLTVRANVYVSHSDVWYYVIQNLRPHKV